jgi:hypothetical protein
MNFVTGIIPPLKGDISGAAGKRSLKSLISEEIEYVAKHTAVGLEDFCILAPGAGYRGEFQILNIEDLAQNTSGGSYLTGFITGIAAFRAAVIEVLHIFSFLLYRIVIIGSGSLQYKFHHCIPGFRSRRLEIPFCRQQD